jgi:hypothetical protein
MASPFRPLPVETVAEALAALPVIKSNDAAVRNAVRNALARAIASGQDAGQLGQDLSAQSTWLGVDLKTASGAPPQPAPRASSATTPPAWVMATAQVALQAKSALCVAVLDRDPSTVTTLSLPVWAIGQKAAVSYAPISIGNSKLSSQSRNG